MADVVDSVDAELGSAATLLVDGGLSANAALMQRQADLCGRPIAVADHHDNTAAGVAGFAAIGAGELDLAGLADRARFSYTVEPALAEGHRVLERARWRQFVETTAPLDPPALNAAAAHRVEEWNR